MSLSKAAVASLRGEFPALKSTLHGRPIVFFDGPGGTQVHESVVEAMKTYLTSSNSNAHGAFAFSRRTDEATHEARRALGDFLNASRPEEIVFGPNMTTLTFRVSQAIGATLGPGDEVIVTRLDHDANISPWMALQSRGVRIHHVDFDPVDCTLNLEDLDRFLNDRIKLVAVGYASNAVGTINDVKRITDRAHEAGALVFIDAVHYAPHGPIDVDHLGCDFLVCSPYKFFGPHLGVLYARHDLLEALPALKVAPASPVPPEKFETGTNNFEGIVGAGAAVNYLASVGTRFGSDYESEYLGFQGRRKNLKLGMHAIRSYERQLCGKLLAGLKANSRTRIYGVVDSPRLDQRVPTVGFTVQGQTARAVASKLGEKGIFVWDGHFYAVNAIERLGLHQHGGLVRVGLCHYNSEEEVETLLQALDEVSHD
ncbi:MAG: cysteine desulfurase-like protein [Desulfomonilaceae bacterium]